MRFYGLVIFSCLSILCSALNANAQIQIGGNQDIQVDYSNPVEYELGGVVIKGARFLDQNVLISLSGFVVGEKVVIPGDKVSKAIENLWKQGLFSDIKIGITRVQGTTVFLEIQVAEKPRLSKYSIVGASKSEADKIREKKLLISGKVVTENLKNTAIKIVKDYFIDKGYLDVAVDIEEKRDSTVANSVILKVKVNKKDKVKIEEIKFVGNKEFNDQKLHKFMKETKESKWYRIFGSSKFIEKNYEDDKRKLIERYNTKGFRNARLVSDTVYRTKDKKVAIAITIDEGNKFYFRNIDFVGNTKHSTEELKNILAIKKGDIYDPSVLQAHIDLNPSGRDIRSLYMDEGYLFFQVEPIETKIENDSIDLVVQISEGKQAIVNKVTVQGNTKTNDRVIMREIRTRPGQLFSRTDIIRTQRELSTLGYFNAEKMNVIPKPNPVDGTVDINYIVEEKASDQFELSGGYGAGQFVGTVGLRFTNFSARNLFNPKAYHPLPMGDGEQLSLRIQTNGVFYQSYSISFVEPWFGGKRPNTLSTSFSQSIQVPNGLSKDNPNRQAIYITGASVGLGRRLRWPDDFFSLFTDLSYQHYKLQNYSSAFLFSNGNANNLSLTNTITRNSIDQPIYPRSGSEFVTSLQLTPPYSLFSGKDFGASDVTAQDKFRWLEYYKVKIKGHWYTRIVGDLVLSARAKFGFLGFYNKKIGQNPFERFYLGGDGLTGFNLDGREIIALRGYNNNTLTPQNVFGNFIGATVYDKYTLELRYPISLNPNATIYGLTFMEAGNSWLNFKDFNPFQVRRSVGVGLRLFLPMFGGLLGIDYGYGLDNVPGVPDAQKQGFHFSIGASME